MCTAGFLHWWGEFAGSSFPSYSGVPVCRTVQSFPVLFRNIKESRVFPTSTPHNGFLQSIREFYFDSVILSAHKILKIRYDHGIFLLMLYKALSSKYSHSILQAFASKRYVCIFTILKMKPWCADRLTALSRVIANQWQKCPGTRLFCVIPQLCKMGDQTRRK